MERNQDVDVLNKTCFPLLENAKFAVPVEKCPSSKISENILQQGNSGSTSNFNDSSFLSNRNPSHLDHPFNSSVVSINSSPHTFESNSYQQLEEKKTQLAKISEHMSGHELMRHAGIGRGKHRAKYSSVSDVEASKVCPSSPPVSGLEIDADKTSNSIDHSETESETPTSNLEVSKMVKSSTENAEFSTPLDITTVNDSREQLLHTKLNDNQIKSTETKSVPNSTVERFREHDFRRLQNGIDSGNKSYKGKPFKLARFHNNGASSVQYKSYDNRSMPQHFPLPPNLKPLRTVKSNEAYYRHNDNRRNQSSKPPFPTDVDKTVYSKPRPNICGEKELSGYDSNRNLPHNYATNKGEINHITVSDSYVPRAGLSAFRRRSFGNKGDHVNNSKQWSSNRLYSDSNTSTVSCHSRTVVTPAKSLEPRHCRTCNLSDKNGNSNNSILKSDSCDTEALEHAECFSPCDRESARSKASCSPSPENVNHFAAVHNSGNQCTDSSNESLHLNNQLHTAVMQFPLPADDPSGDSELPHHQSSYESGLTEKSVLFPSSGLPSCDPQCENIYSSHQKGQENSSLPKQPLVSSSEAIHSPVSYNGLNHCASSTMTVTQASYADIIRTPTAGLNKVSVSHVFHPSSNVPKANEISNASIHDAVQQKEVEPPNSSEWIISRLSQPNVSVNSAHSINGVVHHQASGSHDGVHPRPIAVSLEKPSFYNSSFGVGKTLNSFVQQSNLSSPEKRMLECQIVEEHLCGMFVNKKADEKLSFLSELPTTFSSSGEHASSIACANARTDSIFSDSSSVCSSTSSTFKTDVQRHVTDTRGSVPPVIIMNNCMPLGNVSDISFGIEMDEIIQICSDNTKDTTDACSFSVSDLDISLKNSVNIPASENDVSGVKSCTVENMGSCLNFLTVGGKKFLWEADDVDVSKCNIGHIVDFLQESWHHVEIAVKEDSEESSDVVKYYSDE